MPWNQGTIKRRCDQGIRLFWARNAELSAFFACPMDGRKRKPSPRRPKHAPIVHSQKLPAQHCGGSRAHHCRGTTGCADQEKSAGSAAPTITYEGLGVRRVINGRGTVTVLGGSIMPPEVVAAMVDAAKSHVSLPDLQRKAGAKIAEMIGVPRRDDCLWRGVGYHLRHCGLLAPWRSQEGLSTPPDVTDVPNEIISQKAHRCGYEAQMWLTGARTTWVETREELENAISDKTAMMFFLNKADPDGQIKRAEWIEIARKHGVPTLNDAAARRSSHGTPQRLCRRRFRTWSFSPEARD